ncbi:MAG TPA: hypothetical protein DIS66_06795 [Candidatus Omnitrophica bacterium]|nr:hypothetical protein [Candidatus Omnitrophota bacterium]
MRKFFLCFLTLCFVFESALPGYAQDAGFEMLQKSMMEMQKNMQQLQQTIAQQSELIQKQQLQINAIENKTSVAIAGPNQTSIPVMAGGLNRAASGKWNPEIGVIADIVGQVDSPSREDEEGRDRISARHLELSFGSAIDAYSRLDATVALSDFEDVHLEEAYYTNHALPWGLTGRLGRMKPRIGKVIPIHRDSLDTVDVPLVIQRFFGPEGFSKSGADLTKPFSFTDKVSHSVAFGILEGGSGEDHGHEEEEEDEEDARMFGESRRHPTLYAHLKNYLELTPNSGIEGGVSYLTGGSDTKNTFGTHVIGSDLTWIWNYADQRHVKLQGESFFGSRSEERGEEVNDEILNVTNFPEVDDSNNFWGSYILADWRFHPKWAVGSRFDHVSLIKNAALEAKDGYDMGWATYLTFYQSEFARWRLQLNQRNLTDGKDPILEGFIQGTFAIGEHKHKIS